VFAVAGVSGLLVAGARGSALLAGAALGVVSAVALTRTIPGRRTLRQLPGDDGARVIEAVRTGGAVSLDLAPDVRSHVARVERRLVWADAVRAMYGRWLPGITAIGGVCLLVGGLAGGDLSQAALGGLLVASTIFNLRLVPRLQANALARARRARDRTDLLEAGGDS
jgi:hypothetical protein